MNYNLHDEYIHKLKAAVNNVLNTELSKTEVARLYNIKRCYINAALQEFAQSSKAIDEWQPKPRNLFTNEVFDQLIQQLFNSSCCTCTSCVTHHLEKMAYDWIQETREVCPKSWQEKRAAIGFASIFERKIKIKISELFHSSKCVSDSSISQLANQSQSSLLDVKNISQVPQNIEDIDKSDKYKRESKATIRKRTWKETTDFKVPSTTLKEKFSKFAKSTKISKSNNLESPNNSRLFKDSISQSPQNIKKEMYIKDTSNNAEDKIKSEEYHRTLIAALVDVNCGQKTVKEAADYYGISEKTLHIELLEFVK
ncbi:uncharacterized protein LOC105426794 [Pogonomyrmex barbatus]|uniref:Uncharacterized protein LOC105426794 n=1 Tax=Pogonomyrmex barbatus TaxID=144034 RepID=A0A6I9WX55_9HYME|nr:uncharacterized protein LOC105426794 [Pogonomyrmex barbatus]